MNLPPAPFELSLTAWKYLRVELGWAYDDAPHPLGRGTVTNATWISAWLLREGMVEIHNERRSIKASAGQWVFPPLGERRQIFSEDARILSVNFNARWPSERDIFDLENAILFEAKGAPELEVAAMALLHALPANRQSPFDTMKEKVSLRDYAAITAAMYVWVAECVQAVQSAGYAVHSVVAQDERIQYALSLLDNSSFQRGVKEEDIAREVGLSVRQLCRLFQEQVGTSPARYFDRKRLLRAFQLLIDVSMPIKEVSYQLGFSSPAYFSHWFKSQTGTSPRTFRSQQ